MIKPTISLQELRAKIGQRAKSAPAHRFWGLHVHIMKPETLEAAYVEAKRLLDSGELGTLYMVRLIAHDHTPCSAAATPKDSPSASHAEAGIVGRSTRGGAGLAHTDQRLELLELLRPDA